MKHFLESNKIRTPAGRKGFSSTPWKNKNNDYNEWLNLYWWTEGVYFSFFKLQELPSTCCWYSLYSSIHLQASLACAATCWRNTRHLQTCFAIKTVILSLSDIYHAIHLMTGQKTWYDMPGQTEAPKPHKKTKVLLFPHCFRSPEPANQTKARMAL